MSRVLIVDDDDAIALALSGLLEDEGHACEIAASGQEGLDALHRQRFDLVVSDVMMPVLDGREMTRRMRQQDGLKDVPVVLMSAAGHIDAKEVGAQAFLQKPFDIDALLNLVERFVGNGASA